MKKLLVVPLLLILAGTAQAHNWPSSIPDGGWGIYGPHHSGWCNSWETCTADAMAAAAKAYAYDIYCGTNPPLLSQCNGLQTGQLVEVHRGEFDPQNGYFEHEVHYVMNKVFFGGIGDVLVIQGQHLQAHCPVGANYPWRLPGSGGPGF